MGTSNIFNGASKIGGIFEAFSDDKVMIEIAKGSSGNDELNKGFLAEGYSLRFQRGIAPRRFLNDTSVYYSVGFGTGTLTLQGIVGRKDAFDQLLGSGEGANDVCNPLTITITPNFFKDCTGDSGQTDLKYICGQCMAVSVDLTGRPEQQGIIMSSGTLVFQIGSLKVSSGGSSAGNYAGTRLA